MALEYLAPELFRRAAFGLQYELREVPRDREKMLTAMRESLARGRPVISLGIVGPPEAGIVTGYSQGGEVLHGWSYHQGNKWPGMYEQGDWFARFSRLKQAPDAGLGPTDEPPGLLIVGDKNRWREGAPRDVLVESLKWAVDLERTAKRPNLPHHVCGLAAYEAWAKALAVDADYPKNDAEVMDTRHMVQTDQAVMAAERGNAAGFLRLMAEAAPEALVQSTKASDGLRLSRTSAIGSHPHSSGPRNLPPPSQSRSPSGTIHCLPTKAGERLRHLSRDIPLGLPLPTVFRTTQAWPCRGQIPYSHRGYEFSRGTPLQNLPGHDLRRGEGEC